MFFLSAIFCSNFSFAQNCNTPTGLFTSGISNYSATLNWNLDSDIDNYRLRYKEMEVHLGRISIILLQILRF